MKFISLFSGYGSHELSLKYSNLDYELVSFCENDKTSIKAFNILHKDVPNLGDITKLNNIPDCDILFYSFPCQDISIMKKGNGFEGRKSGLIYEVLRLLKNSKLPKVLIMENVKNILSKTNRPNLHKFMDKLKELNYASKYFTFNGIEVNVPQNRERVFMISILDDNNNIDNLINNIEKRKQKECQNLENYLNINLDNYKNYDDELKYEIDSKKKSKSFLHKYGQINSKFESSGRIYNTTGVSPCLITSNNQYFKCKDKIIKLNSYDRYKLMGLEDEDINKLINSDISNAQHSKLTGNSIIVNVLKIIFEEIFLFVK